MNTTAAMISGTLFLHMFSNGMVQEQFLPKGMDGNTRPIVAINTEAAQLDLSRVFDLSVEDAQSAIFRLCRDNYVELAISIEESKLQRLFRSKPFVSNPASRPRTAGGGLSITAQFSRTNPASLETVSVAKHIPDDSEPPTGSACSGYETPSMARGDLVLLAD